jgi:mannitol-1-phosphate/altronate dehydrogenase
MKRLMETSNKKIKLKDKGIKFQKKLENFSERDIRLLNILKTIYTYKDQMQLA